MTPFVLAALVAGAPSAAAQQPDSLERKDTTLSVHTLPLTRDRLACPMPVVPVPNWADPPRLLPVPGAPRGAIRVVPPGCTNPLGPSAGHELLWQPLPGGGRAVPFPGPLPDSPIDMLVIDTLTRRRLDGGSPRPRSFPPVSADTSPPPRGGGAGPDAPH